MFSSFFRCVLLTQSCLTLRDLMGCIPPGSSVHGILQARTLERVAIPFSRRKFGSRESTCISCIAGRLFTVWATREAPSCFEYQIPGAELGEFETKQFQLCLSLHNLLSHPKTRTLISPPLSNFLMCYCLVVIISSQLCILQYGIGVLACPLSFCIQSLT